MTDVNKEYKETMQETLLELKIKATKILKKIKEETKKPKIKF
ncbi:MAG TPA: hypothetical protein VLD64_09075 [Nitrosarchaeum sp.]|nr:hypothetical protein [Nitrosarchaeum sp.]